MRTYDDILNEYLVWKAKKTNDTQFHPLNYLADSNENKEINKALAWKELLDFCYRKEDGIFWFVSFILGGMTYAGYPSDIRFNSLWWKWTKLVPTSDHLAIVCARQHGKEQPYSAKVLTPTGWTTMGQLHRGDQVFSEDGRPTNIVDIFEQGEKDVYKITFTDDSSVECGLDHNWKVRKSWGTWKVLTLRQMLKNHGSHPNSDDAYRIPLTRPIEFPERSHYIPPYVLGLLLGDGGLTQTSCNFTTGDTELIDSIRKDMTDIEIQKTGKFVYRLIDKKVTYGETHRSILIDELKRLGLWGKGALEKHIPDEYLFDSVENRTQLLRGLMDTDGNISDTCIMEFYSISHNLTKQVQFLVQSLGGKARIREKEAYYKNAAGKRIDCNTCYRLKIWIQNINPFKLERKAKHFYNIKYKPERIIKSIEPVRKEQSRCIMVDNPLHTYLSNDCIVTHNSTYWSVIQPVYRMCLYENYNVLISSASEDQATSIMNHVVKIIENNEFLISKKAHAAKWSTTELHYNGGKIVAKGVGAEVRGGTYDYISCDDILRSDNKLSDSDIENYVDEELEPMLFVRKGQLVIVGTRQSDTDIFSTLEDRVREGSNWKLYVYPAILNWENKTLLSPDRFTWDQLMKIRKTQTHIKFDKEFMCVCVSHGSQIFPKTLRDQAKSLGSSWTLYSRAKEEDQKDWFYYGGVDIARAGTAAADYSVIFILAFNPNTQEKRIVWVWRKKGLKISEQVEQVAQIAKDFNYPIILVEKNNMGQDFIDQLVDNYGVNVEAFTTGAREQGKSDLIRYLLNAFENGKMIIPTGDAFSREQMEELDIELSRFIVEVTASGNERMKGSGHRKDDMVMALALANRCSQSFGYTPFAASIDNNAGKTPLEKFVNTGDDRFVMKAPWQ